MENSCDISNVNFFQNVFRFVEQSIFNQSQTQLLCYKMKNLTFSSASCKNNQGQCVRSAVSPPYLLKHQLWTWFPGLCLFGDCRLPLPSLPSCSRFCRGSVSACPKLQPRPGRPSVRQQKQQREVAWKWTAHQGLVRRGVVGLHHNKELRSARGNSINIAPNAFQTHWTNILVQSLPRLGCKERQKFSLASLSRKSNSHPFPFSSRISNLLRVYCDRTKSTFFL